MMYAKVIVGLNNPQMDKMFDYGVPEGMKVRQGVRVIVPFGSRNKKEEGYVISLSEETDVPEDKIKNILEMLDEGKPTFTPELLELAEWMRSRYFCTLNQCLQAIMPAGIRTKSSWAVNLKVFAGETKLTPKEKLLVDYIGERKNVPLDEIQAEFSGRILDFLRRMEEKGLLEIKQQLRRSEYKKEKKLYSLDMEHPLLEAAWKKAEKDKRLEGQRLILEYLRNGEEATAEELKEKFGITESPIKTLLCKGILKERKQTELRNVFDAEDYEKTKAFAPTAEQADALAAIRAEMAKEEKRPVLLHGITGSGKTEIYMQIIADVLAKGQQAIVLVPEIALTPLILERFISRFGDAVSVTHSRLSMGERVDQWKKARDGEISVIIGPRSALFMPFQNVGAIIMDEAHENSYVSDITPKYDTRDVAAEAAKKYNCLFLMGTATPDLVSYHRAKEGEYLLLELNERTGGGTLPEVFVTDMRKELAEGNRSAFSRELQKAIRENLRKGEQTMLFLNRRGYATFVSCRSCGHVMTCPECDITYTYHAKENALVCHYCGRRADIPKVCPECGSKYIRYFGTGTQKIEEEARKLFPEARILRMDLDTTMTKHSHEKILEAFGKGEADILIGTQMIAKGHDYPNVTLVGIMAADLSLNVDSYTASETGFRLMTQAAGRAGRRDDRGRVFIQTYQPEHYAVKHAADQDFKGFFEEEILMRQMMGYPPFSAFFSILIVGEEKNAVEVAAQKLAVKLAKADGEGIATILGPVPAALAKFRGEYRWQLIIKAAEEEALRELVLPVVESMKKDRKSDVRYQVSLNPVNIV
ncbi:primosomal protein N' [Anaerotignum sp.]|nr:primosomal protein N' [Anaerotignum sp.]MBQ7758912.1 primosomal protein N' [Anaerotignum sp.]